MNKMGTDAAENPAEAAVRMFCAGLRDAMLMPVETEAERHFKAHKMGLFRTGLSKAIKDLTKS